jgi:hypothetical protein
MNNKRGIFPFTAVPALTGKGATFPFCPGAEYTAVFEHPASVSIKIAAFERKLVALCTK